MTEIPESNYRRCSRCGKTFTSRAAADEHIVAIHAGDGERVPVMKKDHPDHPDYEPSEWEQLRQVARGARLR